MARRTMGPPRPRPLRLPYDHMPTRFHKLPFKRDLQNRYLNRYRRPLRLLLIRSRLTSDDLWVLHRSRGQYADHVSLSFLLWWKRARTWRCQRCIPHSPCNNFLQTVFRLRRMTRPHAVKV